MRPCVRDTVLAAERLMEAEGEARTGAAHGLRDPARQVQRNGYRERAWDSRAGRIDLEIPRLCKGHYFPSFLEPRTETHWRRRSMAHAASWRYCVGKVGRATASECGG